MLFVDIKYDDMVHVYIYTQSEREKARREVLIARGVANWSNLNLFGRRGTKFSRHPPLSPPTAILCPKILQITTLWLYIHTYIYIDTNKSIYELCHFSLIQPNPAPRSCLFGAPTLTLVVLDGLPRGRYRRYIPTCLHHSLIIGMVSIFSGVALLLKINWKCIRQCK